ncbi:FAD/FMN-containing protein [Aspergillus fischeri NRRL 181]|uniref:FAD binding domain protein n=1 Tax=Neosartorya fischeri (strain ATCC 1020 / DSM 3700 / CBS 544.65 / FGSC A1164 / JCM 1740 / NRRL 181 / WB 181) TaxID=331117 RepID=A1D105_NEOFI|nr:FAD binding domain protein [Aspergillus fischeri NRRL 181]EAW22098.1 FAD binding domain protein [Aspergillus fischeri NRRL 181]
MILHAGNLLSAVGILTIVANAEAHHRRRCAYGDDCWPDSQTWNDFNATVGGRLIRSFPSAAVCHTRRYNANQCNIAKKSWLDSFWRTNQTGAYSATVWEMGNTGQCFMDTPVSAPCHQGLVPYYSVRAESVEDIQKTVKFASEKDLSLVIKNTGHDHLGRSSGKGALSLWTHNIKGIDWHDSFVPQGAPAAVNGIPAATLQAGEQWFDVYQAAAKQGVLIVGGSARTVGAAGGYVLGGGHSPFAHYYGLAADNVLEMSIVSADGRHRVINAYSDPEYFWAVRGGGGSAWGVVTSVTYKTHPVPQNLTIGFVQLNATNNSSSTRLISESLKLIPAVTDAGYTGYGSFAQGFQAIFLQPNGTIESFNRTFAPFSNLTQLPGVTGALAAYSSTWNDYLRTFLQDPNIGTNIQDTSRLLTADIIRENADGLAQFIVDNDQAAGFNFSKRDPIFSIGKVNNKERDNTAVHEIWKHSHALLSISVNWLDNATACEKEEKRHQMVQLSKRFTDIVGPDGGTYVNEASPYEPQWQRVFWGKKYDRLLSVKKRVDPTQLFVCNRCVGTDLVLQP